MNKSVKTVKYKNTNYDYIDRSLKQLTKVFSLVYIIISVLFNMV